jgi:hypothetical protein
MAKQKPQAKRQRGQIERLPSGSLRVSIYAGIDPVSKERMYLRETVPAGQKAGQEAEKVRTRLLNEVYERRNPRTDATVQQLAKTARDGGDEATAAAIAALRKPTIAAWLANQLVRADPDGIHALAELGEQLRQTYLTADSTSRRELTRQRHDLVRRLVHAASQRAAGGRRVTAQTAERLTETLDAALVDPGAAQLLRTGQLTSALRHVGFGVVDENGDPAQLALTGPPSRGRSSTPVSKSCLAGTR